MKNRDYSAIYRIIHWLIAISMVLILITIFLRSTWMNRGHMAGIIQDVLSTGDQTLSRGEINSIARNILQPMWQWHIYLGYILVGLFGIRFLLPIFGEMKFLNPLKKGLTIKEKMQSWIYIVFYLCIATSLTTGLFMEFGPKSLKKPMEEVHVLSIYYLIGYIILHLGGVLLAEFTDQNGIISRVVSGKSKKTDH